MKRTLVTVFVCLAAVPVLAKPDLVILNATSNPATAEVTKQYTITFDLKNAGDQPVDGAHVVVKVPLAPGGSYIGCTTPAGSVTGVLQTGYVLCRSIAGTSLAGGATLPMTVTLKAPASQGSFTTSLQADPDGLVDEGNEGNNGASVSTGFVQVVRAGVAASLCPTSASVGPIYAVQLGLKNTGTADIRYPGLIVEIQGGGVPVTLASVDPRGGTITPLPTGSASTVGTAQVTHKFLFTPSAADIPLRAGTAVPVNINLRSSAAQTVKVIGSFDTQAIQDTTSPKDNSAACTISVR